MDGVDAERLGVRGTSYSGGHVLCVARDDRRVRAAVAQVPTISGGEATRRRGRTPPATEYVPAADIGGRDVDGDGGPPVDPTRAAARAGRRVPGRGSMALLRRAATRAAPHVAKPDHVPVAVERYAAYEPGACLPHVAVPLLVVLAEDDTVTPSDLIRGAVNASGEHVVTLAVPGGHYAVYTNHRERTATAAAAFIADHLR